MTDEIAEKIRRSRGNGCGVFLLDREEFSRRYFLSEENRQLAMNEDWRPRLMLGPMTIRSLDNLGLSHLSIIFISQMAGRTRERLSPSDCDMLDWVQDEYDVAFDAEEQHKVLNKKMKLSSFYTRVKVSSVASHKDNQGRWLKVTSLVAAHTYLAQSLEKLRE